MAGEAQGPPEPATGWWRRLLDLHPARRRRRASARALYGRLVAKARAPGFYATLGVPDTAEGRFEMIGLHVIVAIRRLRREGAEGEALAQCLFDAMFADMDRALREMGVGDLSVGKHVKHLARTFLARAQALEPLLEAGDGAAMAPILVRNVYHGGPPPDPRQVDALAAHLLALERRLRQLELGDWLAGGDGPAPPAA